MINKHIQRNRDMAKRELKKRNMPRDEVKLYHVYDNPRELSYWDDFAFRLGSQRVVVTWVHPRMALANKIEEMAFDLATQEVGSPDDGFSLDKSQPHTRKVGRSRKKVIGYRMSNISPSLAKWHETVRENEEALMLLNISVGLEYRVTQWETGRNVRITYPVELRNEDEIFAFGAKVKAHMMGEIDLFAGLENYSYSTADYRREHPEELIAHKVKG